MHSMSYITTLRHAFKENYLGDLLREHFFSTFITNTMIFKILTESKIRFLLRNKL